MSLQLNEFETEAQRRMDAGAFAYVAGGAGDEACLRRNSQAWGEILLSPQRLVDFPGLDIAARLLGLSLEFPCLVAPMAFQRLADPLGERAMAMAAAAQGAGFVLSCQTSVAVEDAVCAPFWFQLYMQPTLNATLALVNRAVAAGAVGVVVTIDAPLNGVRNREIAAGFRLPDDVRAVMLPDLPAPQGDPIAGLLARAPKQADLAAVCAASAVPVLAKGVMSADEALLMMRLGCAGVIVSNHGGRVLAGLPATAQVLPAIRRALPDALVLVDGGIRSGEDMFRALALGADAVLLGRPAYFALAVGGAQAASACLRRLRDEFAVTMGLMGTPRLADIGPHCLIT